MGQGAAAHGPQVSRVDLAAVTAAAARIAGAVARTPLLASPALSARAGVAVALKCDHRQPTGSFKLRGATNALASLDAARRKRGVVTASTGNHGRALAHAARRFAVPAHVCLSALVPANKVEAVRASGALVHIVGRSQDEAQAEAERRAAREGLTLIPPFDHPAIIAGQGTLGLELVADMPDLACVLVPLSGGGLAAGVATAVKALRPGAQVIGLSMARGAAMATSLKAGRPVLVAEEPTLADSLGGGVGLDNRCTFAICRDLLDDVILLSEDEIAEGMRHAFHVEGETIEGAAAVGIAALLAGRVRPCGPTVALLTGAAIDPALHARVMAGGIA